MKPQDKKQDSGRPITESHRPRPGTSIRSDDNDEPRRQPDIVQKDKNSSGGRD